MILLPITHHLPQGYGSCWRLFRERLEGMDSSGEGCCLFLFLLRGVGAGVPATASGLSKCSQELGKYR